MTRKVKVSDLPPSLRAEVEGVLAAGQGASGRECPECRGGRGREGSLSLWSPRPGVVALKCWRNSCNYCADVLAPGAVAEEPAPPVFEPSYYEGLLRAPSVTMQAWMTRKYGVSPNTARRWGVRHAYREPGRTLYLPVYGPEGDDTRGHVASL